MKVNKWFDYIQTIHKKDIDYTTKRLKIVASKLDVLSFVSKVIIIAGTNGKGTTASMIAYGLMQQNFKVGVYSSPHILTPNERIQVNGENISDADFIHAFEVVESAREDIKLTFFEFLTLAAYWHFKKLNLDYIIIECGLGARLDATNIVKKDIGILTSIGLDHTDILGDTLLKIAKEKSYVWQDSLINLNGSDFKHDEFEKIKADYNVINVHEKVNFNNFKKVYEIDNTKIEVSSHIDQSSAKLAIYTLWILGKKKFNFKSFNLKGRFSTHNNFTVDVAHNPESIIALKEKLLGHNINIDTALIAFKHTKDSKKCIEVLKSFISNIYWLSSAIEKHHDIDIKEWDNKIESNKKYLVTGSFLTVEFFYRHLLMDDNN